ncbi:MAG: hypothetical protein A2636_04805 [Elusimicrobia bacterium RIFCSPHIGHO2_01_FULL_64_10]|nr:MAG: hypothetical protein A2636_04805 [Elusimicrobia bacterium RIFCSPHIGHO2_01_FULL_64_10]
MNDPALRKTFFVKPRLQFKTLVMTLLMTLVCTALVYLTVSHSIFNSEKLRSLSPADVDALRWSLRIGCLWILLVLLLAFGLENLFRFHKLIGPIFGIERVVKSIASGDLTQPFHSRKRDELRELVDELSAMREGLRQMVVSDRAALKEIDAALARIREAAARGGAADGLSREIESVRGELARITSRFKI